MNQKEQCFNCNKQIIRKYVLAKKTYSLKNNWDYWTEDKDNEGKFICNKCLLEIYYNDKGNYLNLVQNEKKRRIFTTYVYNKTIA
jgi:hypothetical protein